ncbi:DUF3667 domain-containing protein [Nonlabens marinus]|uniref:DUF3667 domain-containing protein n=1 Tax=Nonlabens marinus S1-08 TaxID=1454201 RepID=W8VQA1_9FLAO|nr:DUF3667 domain-containing protein [Nonlabens marinus]BAO55554.1 hypothetical protein NMS_1545 [Nonlabens marinus S1-08]
MLYTGHTHCASCGAKWIQNRITMRQVGMDFSDMYLGLDTKFAHTFKDLFTKPGQVINGYINGRRGYYMDAIRYLLLVIFASGIYIFIVRSSGSLDEYMAEFGKQLSASGDNSADPKVLESQKRMSDFMMDYTSVLTLLTIPLLALVGRITFWGKRYFNYTEHIVFYLYTYAHITLATIPISILLLLISPEAFTYWSLASFPIMFVYNAYSYKQCFRLDWQTTILRSLISIIVLIASVILLFLVVVLLAFLTAIIADKLGFDVKGFFANHFGT